ncbi:Rv3235 family protein [Candidatus Rhodoluna planktonica]|uniref:3-hydroxyacyl-CoA dehydrogenase n=1 Tax=Candidatus Rhodoluna planktonica TaxID=535712 RepID=A0A1D9DZX5_9MICO|nr:Rv3235 family protein [Candidatus Rhodoluna planktonica]AOY56365.1 hypothetical protein A4Z71_05280 [Candidatus Rhodoluna planktonica]
MAANKNEKNEQDPDIAKANSNEAEAKPAKKKSQPNKKRPSSKKPEPRNVSNPIEEAEFFGKKYNKTSELPDPELILRALAIGVIEVISGTRSAFQLARLLSDGVLERLVQRAIDAQQQRDALGIKAKHQHFTVGSIKTTYPREGVVESAVIMTSPTRNRAVAIRLEGFNDRWRAVALSVL